MTNRTSISKLMPHSSSRSLLLAQTTASTPSLHQLQLILKERTTFMIKDLQLLQEIKEKYVKKIVYKNLLKGIQSQMLPVPSGNKFSKFLQLIGGPTHTSWWIMQFLRTSPKVVGQGTQRMTSWYIFTQSYIFHIWSLRFISLTSPA